MSLFSGKRELNTIIVYQDHNQHMASNAASVTKEPYVFKKFTKINDVLRQVEGVERRIIKSSKQQTDSDTKPIIKDSNTSLISQLPSAKTQTLTKDTDHHTSFNNLQIPKLQFGKRRGPASEQDLSEHSPETLAAANRKPNQRVNGMNLFDLSLQNKWAKSEERNYSSYLNPTDNEHRKEPIMANVIPENGSSIFNQEIPVISLSGSILTGPNSRKKKRIQRELSVSFDKDVLNKEDKVAPKLKSPPPDGVSQYPDIKKVNCYYIFTIQILKGYKGYTYPACGGSSQGCNSDIGLYNVRIFFNWALFQFQKKSSN